MPYPEPLVAPMRSELVAVGVHELRTSDEVDQAFEAASDKTMLLIVNSVCGCAAAMARPAVRMAMQADELPDMFTTVFAGQDMEATARAREHLAGIPPSSPSMFLVKDGEPVFALERRHIEGRSASAIATDLVNAYHHFCAKSDESPSAASEETQAASPGSPTFRSIL
ncbi:MAG: BrxA/BrxB family bacilliredoxin [Bacteroidota bacterium]|nr:BrxA/BrxB family bacilliredoxin [Bacteroidota bacterium]